LQQGGVHQKIGEVIKLAGVLYIPRLKNNIISLDQLDERGCKVEIEKGLLESGIDVAASSSRSVRVRTTCTFCRQTLPKEST
jgi:hypothetical protein